MKHDLENINSCPVCNGKSFKDFLKVVDHNVSGDKFNISECNDCGFRFTNPRPKENTICKYYKSGNYISHNSSKKGFINKIYYLVRDYQFKIKLNNIANRLATNDKNLLDVGCGTGDFVKYLKNKGWSATGVETDDAARAFAIEENKQRVLKSLKKFKGESFDVITMWHVLEHIYDLNNYLKTLFSLLKDGGMLVVGVPNNASYDAEFYKENWFAYDPPIHLSHFRKKDVEALASNNNFQLKNIDPLIFDAYYISMLSSKKAKGLALSGFFRGWVSNWKAKKSGNYSSLAYYLFK